MPRLCVGGRDGPWRRLKRGKTVPHTRTPSLETEEKAGSSEPLGVIGLYGLPRSGTTLLAALIGAHSQVQSVYEPWHSGQLTHQRARLSDVRALLRPAERAAAALCVKETATKPHYLANLISFLTEGAEGARTGLVWLVRDPLHAYFSQVAADRRWRQGAFRPGPDTLSYWADISRQTVAAVTRFTRRGELLLVFYEALVLHPERVLREIMAFAGLPFEAKQLTYHETLDPSVVRGDRFVRDQAEPVRGQNDNAYDRQIADLRARYAEDENLRYLLSLCDVVRRHRGAGVVRAPHAAFDDFAALNKRPSLIFRLLKALGRE